MISPRRAWSELAEIIASQRSNGPRACVDNGVGRARQILELVRLRLGPGKLEANDYYCMRVYRRGLSFDDKLRFLSQRAIHLPKRWNIIAHDKLLTYTILEHERVHIPRILAICHPLRTHGPVPALRSADEVSAFLKKAARYPFIAKPITGVFSHGVSLVESIDHASGKLRLDAGEVPVDDFARAVMASTDGTLFQELLKPHRDIAAHMSSRLCTLRLIVLLEREDVRLFRAYWKIAADSNVADNYWRPGNFVARLDPQSGRILQCVTGLGPDFRIIDAHPRTGMPLRGFEVPHFGEAVALTLRVARAFIGMRMQAWDMAITDEGPIALEVNEEGSVFLPQLIDGCGMNDHSFRDYRNRMRQ